MKKNSNFLCYLEGWLSIVINISLFVLKYWAGIVSGSIAIIADAWHTLSDSLTSIIVLIGIKISSKPADEEHPFGHGRAELIGAIIIGIILAGVAFNFIVESLAKLKGHQPASFTTLAIIVTSVSVIVKEALAQYAIWAGKKTGSKSLMADGWHHRSDSISSLIILGGIFLSKYFWWIDEALGIMVAFLIFYATFNLLKDAINPLIGEKPNKELVKKINEISIKFGSKEINLHHLHIHKYGNHTELTFHIQFPPKITLKNAHNTATDIEKEIENELGIQATIHMEPQENNRSKRSSGASKK